MLQTMKTPGDVEWFKKDRFGLFIHWGLYAMPARHEWIKSKEKMTDEHYQRYFSRFDPDLYDPNLWAKHAADAGMKYFVVTTKHHDGFCLWDSKLTDYKSTNTPAGRDLIRPMVDAFRAAGLRAGFYHSLIDWHHPDYVIDSSNHPLRDHPDRDKFNATRDQTKYQAYLHGQVRELLTEYGDIDVLWFDFSFPDKAHPDDFTKGKGHLAWDSRRLYDMIRELAPNIILTDRLDLTDMPLSGGDIKTPEQAQPLGWVHIDHDGRKVPVTWEACQTFSGSWGYHRDEMNWRDTDQLLRTLIDCVSKGGSLLLNVGPTGRGEFDARAISRLQGMGDWMKRHGRSIYGCTQAPEGITAAPDSRLTYNPDTNRLYLHLFAWPYKHVHVPGAVGKVKYAQLLHDASEVGLGMDEWHANQISLTGNDLTLILPQTRPDVAVPVIEMYLD